MSSWFRFIAEPMARALVFLAQHVGSDAGVAIILFTLGVKLLLVPLTLQQLKSAKAMQELQPLIKELQRKHKNDKQRLTEETMALYKEHKVNPAAGCLPMVFQLPILYGLYGALLALGNPHDPLYNPLFTAPFGWLQGLAKPDQLHILPVICVVTQWVQQRMMITQKSQDPQQAAMQNMMQFMPLLIGYFAWNYQSGLALYWAISTTFSIVQQYFITGWGSLLEMPSLGGLGGLLASPGGSQNGTSAVARPSRQPRDGRAPSGGAGQRAKRNASGGQRAGGGKRPDGKR